MMQAIQEQQTIISQQQKQIDLLSEQVQKLISNIPPAK